MWLLNVHTRKLEHFYNSTANSIQYAILSHVWGNEEVTFQDLHCPEIAKQKEGYSKLEFTCRQALAHGLAYAWIDTCCIDKTSSAELSEAINSMFKWYRDSRICYVYLKDISMSAAHSLRNSRWFTRGWTLQELIAPLEMEFFDQDWHFIGTKDDLCSELERITTIPEDILQNSWFLDTISVAKKMAWASSRQTTRPEDMAYCLLGLFDVNIPLLYGEGEKAFYRLQEAIMRQSTDHGLLAWQPPIDSNTSAMGLLASSPADFRACGRLIRHAVHLPSPYERTNAGIRIALPLVQYRGKDFALLNCRYEDDFSGVIGLQVEIITSAVDAPDGVTILRRCRPETDSLHKIFSIRGSQKHLMSRRTKLLLVSHDQNVEANAGGLSYGVKLWVQLDRRCFPNFNFLDPSPSNRWNSTSRVFSWSGTSNNKYREAHVVLEHCQIEPYKEKINKFHVVWTEARKSPDGLYILLLFRTRRSRRMATQKCQFRVISLTARPDEAEIQRMRLAERPEWTVLDDNGLDDIHILPISGDQANKNIQATATREMVMSTPVYVFRLKCLDPDLIDEAPKGAGISCTIDPLDEVDPRDLDWMMKGEGSHVAYVKDATDDRASSSNSCRSRKHLEQPHGEESADM